MIGFPGLYIIAERRNGFILFSVAGPIGLLGKRKENETPQDAGKSGWAKIPREAQGYVLRISGLTTDK